MNTYWSVNYLSPARSYKQSGIGRENGLTAVHEFLQTKSVWIDTSETVADPFVFR